MKIGKKHTDKLRHFLNMLHLMQSKTSNTLDAVTACHCHLWKQLKAFGTDYSVTKSRQTNNATKWLMYS